MCKREKLINEIDRLSQEKYDGYESDKPLKMLEWYIKKFNLLNDAIKKKNQQIYRGEIYWCDLGENVGCEEVKLRPCVIIQNQKGNENAPTTIVAPITNTEINLPVAVPINRVEDSTITGTIDLGQIRVVSKGRLKGHIGNLKTGERKAVDRAILNSLGLYKYYKDNKDKSEKIRNLSNKVSNLTKLLNEITETLGVTDNSEILNVIKDLKD
ncbi:type II toxin-antitoxin system PemK/MazF family toxin [Clostridium coskatii]|uniref:mRNA interferase MazF n=1 Tax=Clostridium coskatii TaxID=1705578 RepID=A0A162L9H1_9CLOT|nr:type II toxin-antitoxin system PemK/MazF family toxin [Clostridium coskatii]OAA86348.1 mRNA interferase MazF [Clostridium coskatii]OAA86366.1 mRNA interferase MazF [Clostridium coskatii]OBR95067.1 mRNA interferase MazF [Clostridium coskatii]